MTSRTLLALGAALLAVSAGVASADGGSASAVGWIDGGTADAAAWTPTPQPTGDAEPARVSSAKLKRVDVIELDAESLVMRHGSKTVTDASMRDSRTTVSLLNRLLGTPSRSQTAEGDGGECFPAGTTYTWGGAIRVAALSTPADLGNAVEIRILRDHVRSRSGDDIELTGPHGVQVGDDIGDRIARAPKADRMSFGSDDAQAWQLLLAEGWTATDSSDRGSAASPSASATASADPDDSGTNGVSALTDDTTVTVLGSPMPVHAQRSC
ncbi:hypothetical protein [Curtobacterium sp. ISL-83]|uniref:hypothetical protein n=1 Tax=Curtobacterium sp. ISL-83 TaxID=2819145 RepID=UPI001BE79FEE|nr:hypothetical protein [Curtobacterium sp. ISL-83]MBT2502464.1 hypothetical protein [Curtobacterium sp. ISL-83]